MALNISSEAQELFEIFLPILNCYLSFNKESTYNRNNGKSLDNNLAQFRIRLNYLQIQGAFYVGDFTMMKQPDTIMTVQEIADYLKIPKSTVYKLAQESKIPAQKVGRHWRFKREVLDRWLENRSEK